MPQPTVSAHGSVAAPGAGANIANIPVATLVGAGFVAGDIIKATAYVYTDGTVAAATDDDNIRLVHNGLGTVETIAFNSSPSAPAQEQSVTLAPWNGINAIGLQAIAAATAGSVYHGTLNLTKVDSSGVLP